MGIFIAELVLKIVAKGGRPYLYFYEPWNVFDFCVIVACLLPQLKEGSMVSALRLLRLFRVLKLINNITELQVCLPLQSCKFGCPPLSQRSKTDVFWPSVQAQLTFAFLPHSFI